VLSGLEIVIRHEPQQQRQTNQDIEWKLYNSEHDLQQLIAAERMEPQVKNDYWMSEPRQFGQIGF
jgi:hypothetical protein